jgi:hypothetical protein
MILFVDNIMIMSTIDDVDILKIRVVLFVDWFVIDDIDIKRMNQIWEIRRRIM